MRMKLQNTSVILSPVKNPRQNPSAPQVLRTGQRCDLFGMAFSPKIKNFLNVIILSLFLSTRAYTDSVPIQIQKVEGGRTEAIVPGSVVPREKPIGFANQSCYLFETSILKTARFTSLAAGKITDNTVWGIQKIANVIFSPIVKALDVRQWAHKKQTSSRGQA